MSYEQSAASRPHVVFQIGVLVAIFGLIFICVMHLNGRKVSLPDAPLPSFSASRAMQSLRQIAQKPHPIGTLENEEVRNYLVAELKSLGFDPQVQSGLAVGKKAFSTNIGMVHNVVVRIPGSEHGKALLLSAHYDSVPNGMGAADDGASVAAILETLRALKESPRLRNDLICVFTDGEEAGLLGAELFVAEHPWAKDVGAVMNFDYRGNRGPVLMFETSNGNTKLIEGLGTVPQAIGNSLMYEVYKLLPNDTDLSAFKRAGIPGMNFAAIDGFPSYHTQLDRPELLDQRTLQQEGEIMLGLVRHFGNSPIDDIHPGNSVYFDVPGIPLIHYPMEWVLPLSGFVLLLFVAATASALKNKEIRGKRMLAASLAFCLIAGLIAGASQLLWMGIECLHPGYRLLLQGDTYNSQWYLLAYSMLVLGSFVFLQEKLRRWISPKELMFGTLTCWMVLLIASSVWMPGASFLFAWPAIFVLSTLICLTGVRAKKLSAAMKAGILLVGLVPGILLFTPMIVVVFSSLTVSMIGIVAVLIIVFLGTTTPLLDALIHRFVFPSLPLVVGATCLAVGSVTAGFNAEHPQPDNLFYAQDGMSGKAFWLSSDEKLDSWTKNFFQASATRDKVPEIFGENSPILWKAAAPSLGLKAPAVAIVNDRSEGDSRIVTLSISSPRAAPGMVVSVEGGEVQRSEVNGQPFSTAPSKKWKLSAYGIPEADTILTLHVSSGTPFRVRARDRSFSLPKTNMLPRPDNMMIQPFGLSDTAQVVTTVDFH